MRNVADIIVFEERQLGEGVGQSVGSLPRRLFSVQVGLQLLQVGRVVLGTHISVELLLVLLLYYFR